MQMAHCETLLIHKMQLMAIELKICKPAVNENFHISG